jgi:LytS/YehU family sensor histidine kinase
LQINIGVSKEQQQEYCIVPLALQLLFENAIKHNAISMHQPLKIDLFINGEEQLIIRNNISKKINPEKGSSMGLQNIQKRYQLLIRKTVVVENDNIFFTVKIPLIKK